MIRPAAALLAVASLAGCGGDGEKVSGAPPRAPDILSVTSPFAGGDGMVKREYTCDGADRVPTVGWAGTPAEAKELVLLLEDPDAPGGTFVHWTVAGILPVSASSGSVPKGVEGENSFGKTGYRGPCPPKGDEPHRYRLIIYALGKPSGVEAGAKPNDVREAIADADPLARGQFEARYGR